MQKLTQAYSQIRKLPRDSDTTLDEFNKIFASVAPVGPQEEAQREVIMHMHKRNPREFHRFISKCHLRHLILWTDAKNAMMHFHIKPKSKPKVHPSVSVVMSMVNSEKITEWGVVSDDE